MTPARKWDGWCIDVCSFEVTRRAYPACGSSDKDSMLALLAVGGGELFGIVFRVLLCLT